MLEGGREGEWVGGSWRRRRRSRCTLDGV